MSQFVKCNNFLLKKAKFQRHKKSEIRPWRLEPTASIFWKLIKFVVFSFVYFTLDTVYINCWFSHFYALFVEPYFSKNCSGKLISLWSVRKSFIFDALFSIIRFLEFQHWANLHSVKTRSACNFSEMFLRIRICNKLERVKWVF